MTVSESPPAQASPDDHPLDKHRVDYGYWAIIAVLLLIACWLLLMPWVPAIASSTMHRFHLRTRSFVLWAIQQPIPSMYNFANRYEVRDIPPDLVDPIFETSEKRYINHFPTRIMTFANTRLRYFHEGTDRWVVIDSSFRGQRLESVYHAKPRSQGGFDMILLESASRP